MKRFLGLWIVVLAVFIFLSGGFGRIMYGRECIAAITYSIGSTGDEVKALQEELSQLGYYDGSIDGQFGKVTEDAVRRFQLDNGLVADGIAGPETLNALGLLIQKEFVEDEVELLAAVIYGEGRGEPYEGQVAIGAVILNRVESELFPNTITGVVYQSGAFDVVEGDQLLLIYDDSTRNAALDALNGWDPTGGALYYWNPVTATSQWIWSIPISGSIGNHVFGSPENV